MPRQESYQFDCETRSVQVWDTVDGCANGDAPIFDGVIGEDQCTPIGGTFALLQCGIETEEEDTTSALITALVFNVVLAMIFILIFCCCRRKHPKTFAPRAIVDPTLVRTPASSSPIAWMKHVAGISDDEMARAAGVDAAMHLVFLRLATYIFAVAAIYGLLVLIPVYATASNDDVAGRLYPDTVGAAKVIECEDLIKLQEERQEPATQLERARFKEEQTGEVAETKEGGFLCFGGKKVSAVDHFQSELDKKNKKFEERRKEYLNQRKFLPAGFVVFDSLRSATLAAQSLATANYEVYTTTQAPEANDVIWKNIGMSRSKRSFRHLLVVIATIALIFFYIIPITFVAGLTTIENLETIFPGINSLGPVVIGILQGVLPTLALLIFMALLPKLMRALSVSEGLVAHSEATLSALQKMYYFQVFNVFLLSIVAGSLLTIASDIGDNPSGIASELGESIPRVGTFFINYVMIQAFVSHALLLSRVTFVAVQRLMRKIGSKSQRELNYARNHQYYDIVRPASAAILVFIITICYSVIAPLILPFAIIYFAFGYFVLRYMYYYVFVPLTDSGGLIFPIMTKQLLNGIIISQLVVAAVLGVKEAVIAAPLIAPLVLYSLLHRSHLNEAFSSVGKYLAVETAVDRDRQSNNAGDETVNSYVDPNLKRPNDYTPDHLFQEFDKPQDLSFQPGLKDQVYHMTAASAARGSAAHHRDSKKSQVDDAQKEDEQLPLNMGSAYSPPPQTLQPSEVVLNLEGADVDRSDDSFYRSAQV
ncbi:uncharacterized protein MONBRDRAFT_25629 [Monosiga brevicollis MX1]|uniref:CSC1/OSCA1-like 7TM region domain-containing protein n=1 Tax=Monosiga brevicollis TaxID=81824 RepID=A9UZY7_MONBE|nr:uncharacterized protein MONBRDRAFT_25629 [Monosiga brevicollis MX1]EDQ89060.1 predicted protein [Monosiga brevicollis MX1]|eukprot:XP_001746165.1 hypothetical protein [Monosiga brevicollis MX1]